MKIYSIIVTYNPSKWIDKCLGSLTGSTIPINIIVVDNGSTDGSQKIIKDKFPDVELILSKENFGFGKANNIGIRKAYEAGADYVFLLNQDAWVESNTIEKLASVQKSNPQYGIISPIHLNGNGSLLDRNFSHYVSYDSNAEFYSDFVLKKQKEVYDFPYVNAAGWLISRKCIQTVGGFDPIFFHYGEDDNYCQRVLFHQLKIGVVTSAFLFHDRQNRANKIVPYSDAYFNQLETSFKSIYANVNENNNEKAKDKIIALKRSILKQYLLLRFSTAKNFKRELTIIEKVIQETEVSKEINRQQGLHYL